MVTQSRALRNILGCYATGIAIITTRAQAGDHVGITVNSFASLSLDPPLVLFSLGRSSNVLGTFHGASVFAVNMLGHRQQDLSSMFAKPSTARCPEGRFVIGSNGCALFADALAHIECCKHQVLEGGDHLIFVGRISRFAQGAAEEPLLFFKGAYGTYVPDRSAALPPEDGSLAEFAVAGWG